MSFVPMAQVIWVYDTKRLSIQQCHALHQQLQSQPRQARYLVLLVPAVPPQFLRIAAGVARYQRLHHVYQQQLKRWSCYWGIPESHCWLEESANVSVFTVAKHVGRPVQVTIVGEVPWSIWRQIACWWVGLKRTLNALHQAWQTSANDATLFKKTMKRTHPRLAVLTKTLVTQRNPGGPHVDSI